MKDYLSTDNISPAIPLYEIPMHDYEEFYSIVSGLLTSEENHCVNYFAFHQGDDLVFLCFIADDSDSTLKVLGHALKQGSGILPALTRQCKAMHGFEREIHEIYGIDFEGHPWLKPVRFPPHSRAFANKMEDYPFYGIESEELHEVGVGPVHAGIIEPGHFRFLCNGEKVLHLEIQLGYQHRGVEELFLITSGGLQRCLLAESIAGDTSIGHSLAHTLLTESLDSSEVSVTLQRQRIIALELERIAVHLGDTAALCADVAFQLGQVVNEALRTLIINTTQHWCGNRFGKGLIRPFGTNYPFNEDIAATTLKNLDTVMKRFITMSDTLFSTPSVLSRFDGIGCLKRASLIEMGTVGMAARMGGLARDIRISHPQEPYKKVLKNTVIMDSGDVLARALLRRKEIEQSYHLILSLIQNLPKNDTIPEKPGYPRSFTPNSVAVRLVEGWRGEICHAAVTDDKGDILHYKIKDPSFHNWMALALAMRGQEISDFPVCNKSFNLSYCGHDL